MSFGVRNWSTEITMDMMSVHNLTSVNKSHITKVFLRSHRKFISKILCQDTNLLSIVFSCGLSLHAS